MIAVGRGRVLAGALALIGAGPAAAQTSDAVQVTATAESGGAAGTVRASVEIAAPPSVVFDVMTDCAKALRIVRGLKSCRVLQSDPAGRWDVREHRVSWSAILPSVRNVFRSDYEADRSIRFARVAGDLKANEGEWTLEPLDDGRRTRVHYRSRIALNAPLPSSMVRGALKRDVPEMLRALRRESLALAGR